MQKELVSTANVLRRALTSRMVLLYNENPSERPWTQQRMCTFDQRKRISLLIR